NFREERKNLSALLLRDGRDRRLGCGLRDFESRKAELLPDLRFHFGGEVGVVAEELLGVLATLADAEIAVAEPRAGLLHDLVLEAEVDELARLRDPLAVADVELGVLERRRHLVLHDLDLRAAADDVVAVLDGVDAPDVDAHRGVELQRAASR